MVLGGRVDHRRRVHVLVCELSDPHRERGREQHAEPLVRGRQASQQVADVPDESQVEHPIRFVQHRDPHRVQMEYLLPEVVDEPSRGADQHVEAGAQHLALRFVAGPAEHDAEPQPRMCANQLRILVDLHRELAGRGEHDGAWMPVAGLRRARLAKQHVHDPDQKCGGLAGAGLGLPFDVAAREHRGQRLRLNGGAVLEAGVLDPAQDRGIEIEARESHVGEQPFGHRLVTAEPPRSPVPDDARRGSRSAHVSTGCESIHTPIVMFIRPFRVNMLSFCQFHSVARLGRFDPRKIVPDRA